MYSSRNTSPRRAGSFAGSIGVGTFQGNSLGQGSQADQLASQAEALIRELRGKNAAATAGLGGVPVIASERLASERGERRAQNGGPPVAHTPPPQREVPLQQLHHVSVQHHLDSGLISPHTSPGMFTPVYAPDIAQRVVEEAIVDAAATKERAVVDAAIREQETLLPLLDAQKKVEQLTLQLDISLQSQKTLSLRLEDTRKRAEEAEVRSEGCYKLQSDNELLMGQLSCLVAASNGNKNVVDLMAKEKQELLATIKALQEEAIEARESAAQTIEEAATAQQAATEEREAAFAKEKAALLDELQDLRNTAREDSNHLQQLKDKVASLENKLDSAALDLSNQKGAHDDQISSLRDDVRKQMALTQDAQKTAREAENCLEDLKRQLSDATNDAEQLRNDIAGHLEVETTLRSEKSVLERQIALGEAEASRLKSLVASLEARLKTEQELSDKRLKEAQEAADEMRAQLHEQVNALHQAKAGTMRDHDATISDLQNRLSAALHERQAAEANSAASLMELEKQLQQLQSKYDLDMAKVKHEIGLTHSAELEELRRGYEAELAGLKLSTEQTISGLNLRNEKLLNEAGTNGNTTITLRQQLDIVTANLREAEQLNHTLRANAQRDVFSDGCQTDTTEITTKQVQTDLPDAAFEEELRTHRTALEELKRRMAEEAGMNSRSLDEADASRRAVQDEVRERERRLHEVTSERDTALQELDAQRRAIEQLRRDLQASEVQSEDGQLLAERMRAKERQAQNLLAEIAARDADLEAQRQTADQLRRDLSEAESLKSELEHQKEKTARLHTEADLQQEKVQESLEQLRELRLKVTSLEKELEVCNSKGGGGGGGGGTVVARPEWIPPPPRQYDYCNPCPQGYSPNGEAHEGYCNPQETAGYYQQLNPPHVEVEVVSQTGPRVGYEYDRSASYLRRAY